MDSSMNIQSIKIKFIEEFAGLNNEALVKKLYEILLLEKKLAYEALLKPMTEQEYINKAIQANLDIAEGDVTDHNDLKKESENW
jgi:hypothetical protein